MKMLGIDYGAKRIGIAISDPEGRVAFPHSVVPNDAHALDTMANLLTNEKIKTVVIGESKNFEGKDNKIQEEIDKFAKLLEAKEMELEISFEPEFLTSHQAEQITGKNEMNDASAAAIILQSFLDKAKE